MFIHWTTSGAWTHAWGAFKLQELSIGWVSQNFHEKTKPGATSFSQQEFQFMYEALENVCFRNTCTTQVFPFITNYSQNTVQHREKAPAYHLKELKNFHLYSLSSYCFSNTHIHICWWLQCNSNTYINEKFVLFLILNFYPVM